MGRVRAIRALSIGAIVSCLTMLGGGVAGAASSLTRGFADDVWFDAVGPQWVPRTVTAGARTVLLEVDWRSVEPVAPAPPFDPTSATDPQYNFGYLDAVMREFAGTAISPTLLVTDAPRWAQGPGGTTTLYDAGAWKPDAGELGRFATALASRYSGSFADPLSPRRTLPRVRYFQAWAEANLNVHLSPQWTRAGGGYRPAAPGIYRGMLDAFYAGIKRARADDVVLTTGLGPYGDLPGGRRIPPVAFLRDLLCVGSGAHTDGCPGTARFDVLAADPYEVGPPTQRAGVTDDASAPDLGLLSTVVRRGVRAGTALPRAHKRLWVTEFSYDSNPPNPQAVSVATQARWLEQSLYVFWREGVDTVFWYLIRDQVGSFDTAYFSGVYFRNGARKPSFEAYRFPLVVSRTGRIAQVWGIAPHTGALVVQRRVGSVWRTVFTRRARAGAVFTGVVAAGQRGSYRAVVGGETSLVWNY